MIFTKGHREQLSPPSFHFREKIEKDCEMKLLSSWWASVLHRENIAQHLTINKTIKKNGEHMKQGEVIVSYP